MTEVTDRLQIEVLPPGLGLLPLTWIHGEHHWHPTVTHDFPGSSPLSDFTG